MRITFLLVMTLLVPVVRTLAGIFSNNGKGALFNENTDRSAINESLKDWTFDTSFFQELEEGSHGYHVDRTAVFRLVNGDNELFLHLFNSHNGYYAHGFDFSMDGEIIQSGSL